ncbi:hypothetical protein [Erwinia sp. E_sp_B04_7]|uniref:hypothetical protein n=1 Tax=unclassified Erwinia TaxID=2622719 RepID=UPI0030D0D7C2
MANEITIIKIPSEVVYPKEFALLERVSMATVYRWTTGNSPRLPIERRVIRPGCQRAGGKVRILYLQWKEAQVRKALGHSRFQIIVGA